MKKLLFIILFLIATPVNAQMLWEYGDFNERAIMAVDNGIVADINEYQGTYEQNISLLSVMEGENLGASTQPAALTTYNLAGSGVSSSATSLTLQSLTLPQNDYAIQDSDLSDIFYITLEPGSKVRQEIVSCTTVAQNSGGTATLSGCTRGLSPITPYTASSTLQFSHAGGSQVIFSDPPQLFNQYPAKDNAETIAGLWKYSVLPETNTSLTATTSNQFTTKEYVDNVTNQGAATSTESRAGISELATRTENASSTAWGATEPHVQQSQHATSTPGSGISENWDVWSEIDGKLNQSWLDLTEDFTFSGTMVGVGIVGEIIAYATSTAPTGWLACDGSEISSTTYANLYDLVGYTYGGSAGGDFNLPDIQDRYPRMASSTATYGFTSGETNHTMTLEELVAHTHEIAQSDTTGGDGTVPPGQTPNSTMNSNSTGSSTPFNILDPYIVVNYIIKY